MTVDAFSSVASRDLFLAEGKAHGGHDGAGTPLGLEWSGDVVATGSDVMLAPR